MDDRELALNRRSKAVQCTLVTVYLLQQSFFAVWSMHDRLKKSEEKRKRDHALSINSLVMVATPFDDQWSSSLTPGFLLTLCLSLVVLI